MMITTEKIRDVSRQIVREFQPERVILFGSHAQGTPAEDSDVDFLIVLPFKGKPVQKAVEIRLKIKSPFPIDLVVRTPEEIRRRMRLNDPFMENVMKTGKVLYEASHP